MRLQVQFHWEDWFYLAAVVGAIALIMWFVL